MLAYKSKRMPNRYNGPRLFFTDVDFDKLKGDYWQRSINQYFQ